ncbi:hypothetical protein FCV25MIE_16836 [Fagus crenata]
MRFLDRISIWCVGLGGLGFAVEFCGEFRDSRVVLGEEESGFSFEGSRLRSSEEFESGEKSGVVLGEEEPGWVGSVLGAREVLDWACGEVLDWAGANLLLRSL